MKVRKFSLLIFVTCLLGAISGCRGAESGSEMVPTPAVQTTNSPQESQDGFQVRSVDGMLMVYIPGGTFQMGSTAAEITGALALCQQHYPICNRWYYERESPQHSVSLDNYWIDQAEVSNAQYHLCVEAGICEAPSTCKNGESTSDIPGQTDYPVACVDWGDAQTYCQWVGARLPTEAEWEYAFRGAAGSIYTWGNAFDGSRLNYCDASCSQSHADDRFDDGHPLTAPAGSFPSGASWAGVLNMGGNLSEWVADWFGDYAPGVVSSPSGPATGSEKVLKGCSWFFHPAYCRGAVRHSADPDTRFDSLGFRCTASTGPKAKGGANMITNSIPVPQGSPPAIDGTLSPDEWAEATVEAFADGSQLFLMQAGEFLYVGIKANEPGTIAGNVFIQRDAEVVILHSSAALGTANYQKGENRWQQVRDFAWCCRGTGNSESAQAERTKFLQDEDWLAANGLVGTPNELEYQIKIPDQDFRMAVVYIKAAPPYGKVPWPAHLADDCIAPASGGLSLEMQFSPDQWLVLELAATSGVE